MPTALQNLLETREVELRRLLDKNHPTKYHQHMRKEFITPQIVLEMIRQENEVVTAAAA